MSYSYSSRRCSQNLSGNGDGGSIGQSGAGTLSGHGGRERCASTTRSSQGFSGGSYAGGRRTRESSGEGIGHNVSGGFGGRSACGFGSGPGGRSSGFGHGPVGGFGGRPVGGFGGRPGGGFGGGFGGGPGASFGGGTGGGFSGSSSYGGGSLRGGFGGLGFGGDDAGFLSNNEKTTMKNLNERLASYLNNVRNLEEENDRLEHLIREWYQKHGQSDGPKDYSSYYSEIDKLTEKLVSETMEKNKLILDIDNARMAGDDFKIKYETEYGLRQSVEGDLQGLRPLLDKLTLEKSSLENEYESLQEELAELKKNHEEMKNSSQHKSGGDVTVEVNSHPGPDLKKVLGDLRHEYEEIIQQNRREVEQWYEAKMDEARQQANSSSQEIGPENKEVAELAQQYSSLEIELQTQMSTLQSLQNNLNDTEGRYNMELQQIASLIEPLEAELASIKCEIQNQNQEYETLLGIKIHLEQEIQQYHQLLEEGKQLAVGIEQEGGSGSGSSIGSSQGDGGSHRSGGISGRGSGGQPSGRISQEGGSRGGSGGGELHSGLSYGGSSREGGHSYSGMPQGGSSRGRGISGGGRQSSSGISEGGSSRGGQVYDGISQGGHSREGGKSYGGMSQGGSSREGRTSEGRESSGGVSQGRSSRGEGRGRGQSPGQISHEGSSRADSEGGQSPGGILQGRGSIGGNDGRQSPGRISQEGSSGSGKGGHFQSSSSPQRRLSSVQSFSSPSAHSQSGSYGYCEGLSPEGDQISEREAMEEVGKALRTEKSGYAQN